MHLKCNLFAFYFMSAEYLQKIWIFISQGSVTTCLKRGEWCGIGFVADFVRFPAVQKFWKSVKIWQSYREFKGGNFLRHSVDANVAAVNCKITRTSFSFPHMRHRIEIENIAKHIGLLRACMAWILLGLWLHTIKLVPATCSQTWILRQTLCNYYWSVRGCRWCVFS